MSHRAATKEAAREERLALQKAEADAAARKRRLQILAGLVAVAAIVVVIVVALSASGGSDDATTKSDGSVDASPTLALMKGIPQDGLVLGKPDAPLTLVEYADLQCPACKMYAEQAFPTIVEKYVRTGKLRIEMKLQSFLGPDSVLAASAVAAASFQDRGWTLIDVFYRNQGAENSGYVTNDFLTGLGEAIPGLDSARMLRDASGDKARSVVEQGSADFNTAGFTGTPSFQLGKTGSGELGALNVQSFDPAEFSAAIDSQLSS